jgi:hypothetical protein
VSPAVHAWRRLDVVGTDLAVVDESAEGVVVELHEVCADAVEGRWSMRATIVLDGRWQHRSADVEVVDGHGARHVHLDDLGGCDVLDLAGNPFTNAFALHGFDDEELAVDALYVDLPSLVLRTMRQRYRRLGPRRWEYADDDTGAWVLTVDDDGVVVAYDGLAERV